MIRTKTRRQALLKVVEYYDENIYGMAKKSTGNDNVRTGGKATKLASKNCKIRYPERISSLQLEGNIRIACRIFSKMIMWNVIYG